MAGDAKATLELVLDTAQLKTAITDIKAVGTETTKATTAVTKLGTESKSLSSKVGDVGKKFGTTIGTLGTLGGTVLNLSRQYQDLSDSQIKVDKMQLKVSKTTEATGKAQAALNKLTDAGVTSGAAYDQALLDVKQSLEAQDLAERNLVEAQEDHQRAQENFWIGLVPTVTSAGTSIISVIKDIGGTKGLGGLKTALTGFGSKTAGLLGGLIGGLGGIGTAASGSVTGINGMTTATTGLGTAMKGLALSSLPVVVAIGGVAVIAKESGIVIHEITSIMKGDLLEAVNSLQSLINLFDTLSKVAGPMGAGFAALSNLKFGPGKISLVDEVARIKKELQGVPQAIHQIDPSLQHFDDLTQGINKTIDSLVGGILGLVRKADTVPKSVNPAGTAIAGIGTAASGAETPISGLTSTITTFVGGNVGLLDALAKTGVAFVEETGAADPLAIAIANVGAAADAANAPLNAIKASSLAGANAFAQQSRRANELAATLKKATSAFQGLTRAQGNSNAKSGGGAAPPVHFIGGPVQGARNPNFRLRSDWEKATIIPKKKAQHGLHEMLKRDTIIQAHRGEIAHIDKPSRMGGGASGDINIQVFVDGVERPARYSIGARK